MVALPTPELPHEITILQSLALDLRWTWSHEGDALWTHVDEQLWETHAQSLDRAAERVRRSG